MSDIPSVATGEPASTEQLDPLASSIAEGGKPDAPATSPETQAPPQSRHSAQLTEYAKHYGLNDESIQAIDSGQLYRMVQGLETEANSTRQQGPPQPELSQPQYHPPAQQPQYAQPPPLQASTQNQQHPQYTPQQQPQPQSGLADFAWQEPATEGESTETPNQLKELASYVNKLKDSFGSQVEKLTAENAQLRGHVQQSAEQSQQVSQQQNSAMWDDIASRVPGLVEYYGKPSQALASPGSIQDQRWGALRDAIYRSANNQGVPSQYVDLDKATADAFAFLQPTQVNTNGTGQNGHPGRAVGGDYRIASQPAPPGTLSVGDDYDQRVAAVNRVIQQQGGRGL